MERYPWGEIFIFHVLRIIIFYPTRHHFHRVAILIAMVCAAAQIYLTTEVTNPTILTYVIGSTTASHLTFTAYIMCAEGPFPDRWRRVRDEGPPESGAGDLDKSPSNFPLVKKLWWMFDIAHSPRMIGWVQEPRDHLPQPPPPSRRTFFQKTLFKFIVNIIIIRLASFASTRSPDFDSRVLHGSGYWLKTIFAAVPLLHHVPGVLAFCVVTAADHNVTHSIVALVFVGLLRSSPTLWPDLWGRWRDAYTIRNFWGRTWHQQMRPMLIGLGRLVSNKFLKCPRGSNRSSYTQLYFAFFLSGAIHFAGDFMSQKRMVYHSFKFFFLQAVGITLEDLAIYVGKQLLHQRGIKPDLGRVSESWAGTAARVLGYCWVILWLCLTLPEWRDENHRQMYSH